jgi:hypothetical protein
MVPNARLVFDGGQMNESAQDLHMNHAMTIATMIVEITKSWNTGFPQHGCLN